MELEPQESEFVLTAFQTERGAVLPEARLRYGTYGKLNEEGTNAVLLPSHYMAGCDGYSWLIGPGRVFDPARDFLIATELFGNGRSSSPSNTPEPLHGPRFPLVTVRDNVQAGYRLLTEQLGVKHLRAVVGFSMGAQQAFQWAVSYPDFMDAIVASAGTAKTYGHGFVRLEGQIAALTADPLFRGGDYTTPPQTGLEAFAVVWTAWLFSQDWWRLELWREQEPDKDLAQIIEQYRTDFIPGADANDLILQMRTWQHHDVGATPPFGGDLARALGSIRARVLYMPAKTDLYFPVSDARYESAMIPRCELLPIPSLWGHPAGAGVTAADCDFLNREISRFLGSTSP